MKAPFSFFLTLLLIISLSACDTKVKNSDSCGDDFLDPGEQCDGSQSTAQRCSDLGYYKQDGDLVCKSDCTLDTSVCDERCGDGLIQAPTEVCDGVALAGASCNSLGRGAGTLACRSDCTAYDFSGCDIDDFCGDGEIFVGHEDCEGADLAGQTCESLGYRHGTLACQANCSFDLSGCGGRCGDGVIQTAFEECDGTNFGGGSCRQREFFTGTLTCTPQCAIDSQDCLTVMNVGMGSRHACALLSFNYIGCWGSNEYGQLGDGTTEEKFSVTRIDEPLTFVQLTVGDAHACGLVLETEGLAVYCWGRNHLGQLGDGSTTDRSTPTRILGLAHVSLIDTQGNSTCALTLLGEVYCWGDNQYGQLGDGTTVHRSTPVQVQGLPNDADDLTVGGIFACVRVLTSGTNRELWCWGSNSWGQLGQDPVSLVSSPVPIQGPIELPKVIAAGRSHICVLSASDTVFCWGGNDLGQLGNGTTTSNHVPQLAGTLTASSLSVGWSHSCALGRQQGDSSNRIYCWGNNSSRQVTDSSNQAITTPTPMTLNTPSEPYDVFAGFFSTCASVAEGHGLYCWGTNMNGLLGDGTDVDRSGPVEVAP